MEQHFENLDQIEKFMKEKAPDWGLNRGRDTFIIDYDHTPAKNYEVIQVFKPGESSKPFAEFWKGFYSTFPDSYTGCYAPAFAKGARYFSVLGNLDFAVEAVLGELEKAS